ncbi:hypothetical protein FACS1894202_12330 [Clostridia bacterium]|nr:hypothetical protein FACS1894202_12330 [Clostridia bacterium]
MAQTSYSYTTPKGVAGGLFDLTPYQIDSRLNGETVSGALQFGMGVVQGATPGANVNKPTNTATADKFEGLVLTGHIQEMNMAGDFTLQPKQTVGVLRYGRAWARLAAGLTVEYGEQLYLITTGANAGLFTNDDTGAIAVNGQFIGEVDSENIAPVEIYNAPYVAPAAPVTP